METMETGTVEVFIRHEDEANGRLLTRWYIHDLSVLIKALEQWGIYWNDVCHEASGQFRIDGLHPHFEIIVH